MLGSSVLFRMRENRIPAKQEFEAKNPWATAKGSLTAQCINLTLSGDQLTGFCDRPPLEGQSVTELQISGELPI